MRFKNTIFCLIFIFSLCHCEVTKCFAKYLVNTNSRIAISLVAEGNVDYREKSVPNKIKYATLNGYDLIITENTYEISVASSWSKLRLMNDIIDMNRYDWIFQIDLDTFIVNGTIRLEYLIAKAEQSFTKEQKNTEKLFIFADDCGGANAGQFFVKSKKESADWLKKLYGLKEDDTIDNIRWWWDNAAIRHLIRVDPKFVEKIMKLNQVDINAYPDDRCGYKYQDGDFIIHWAGNKQGIMDWGNKIDLTENLGKRY